MIEPTWENVQVGDTIKVEQRMDKLTAEFEVAKRWDDITGVYSAAHGLYRRDVWSVVSITRPEPKVVLPTEPGLYVAEGGESFIHVFELCAGEWVLLNTNSLFPIGDGHLERLAPFTKLEPVPVTVKKIIDRMRAWQADMTDFDFDRYVSGLEAELAIDTYEYEEDK